MSTTLVEVYTRPQCALCDDAVEALEALQQARGFTLVERNILEREEWFSWYRYRVPVIHIDGIERLALRFTQAELEAALDGARAKEETT